MFSGPIIYEKLADERIIHGHNCGRGEFNSGDLFHSNHIGNCIKTSTAPFFRHHHAHKAQFTHHFNLFSREFCFIIPFNHTGCQMFLGKFPGGFLDKFLFGCQCEIDHTFSTIKADASPPPIQRVARPYFASVRVMPFNKVVKIRAPEAPMGCPIATAPP